ncbi:MAG TPA: adenylate/guanylate cyclase domain-containing protein, partial [Candidatus Cloacimonas acidaminovorans]|nr:adenylate/guanylate cyclase domain-containing protein [Candidatus Cloacimonas acidaminovorans]
DRIFNYTGIGDKMNFGSRLEGLNKYYLTTIIIDEYTYRAVSNTVFCRKLDKVKVKGKLNPCEIYEIIDTHENMQNQPELISAYHKYETALDLMLAGQKNQAKTLFEEVLAILPSDEPSRIMLNRCEIIDWDTWDGSWQFESK